MHIKYGCTLIYTNSYYFKLFMYDLSRPSLLVYIISLSIISYSHLEREKKIILVSTARILSGHILYFYVVIIKEIVPFCFSKICLLLYISVSKAESFVEVLISATTSSKTTKTFMFFAWDYSFIFCILSYSHCISNTLFELFSFKLNI